MTPTVTRLTPFAAAVAAGAQSFRPTLVPKSTTHQVLAAGAAGVIGYAGGRLVSAAAGWVGRRTGLPVVDPLPRSGPVRAGLMLGITTGGVAVAVRNHRWQLTSHPYWPAEPPQLARSLAGSSAITATTVAGAAATRASVRVAAGRAAESVGGPPLAWRVLGATGALVADLTLLSAGRRVLLGRLLEAGRAADDAFALPPTSAHVSGGPGSLVDYATLGREGRRFVQLAADPERLAWPDDSRSSTPPIRVFVGLDSAPRVVDRVDLAMAELERSGAFERSVLLAVSPAGTGYANPVPVEALEYYTRGDCASVVIQYGLLPSMFSGDRVDLGARTFRQLLDRLRDRIASMPRDRRPRLCLYGESLGAQAAEAALERGHSLIEASGAITGVDAAVMVGTPGREGRLHQMLDAPAVHHLDSGADAQAGVGTARTWLLDHPGDPVTRFAVDVLWRRPSWLRGERPEQVPVEMGWVPVSTSVQMALDVARATQPQLGTFYSRGHDYRADMAPLVRAAYCPQVAEEMVDPVTDLLVHSEVERTQLLAE